MEPLPEQLVLKVRDWLQNDARDCNEMKSLQEVYEQARKQMPEPHKVLRYVVQHHWNDAHWQSTKDNLQNEKTTDFEVFANACKDTLHLVCNVREVCNKVMDVIKTFMPDVINISIGPEQKSFELEGFDEEGRTIYTHTPKDGKTEQQYLRWIVGDGALKGGRWAYNTDKDGKNPGHWHLDSALVTDMGPWEQNVGRTKEPPGSCLQCDARTMMPKRQLELVAAHPIVPKGTLQLLRDVHIDRNRNIRDAAVSVRRYIEEAMPKPMDENFWTSCQDLLSALCDASRKLNMRTDIGFVPKPEKNSVEDLLQTLSQLASLDDDVLGKLRGRLPKFTGQDEKKNLITQIFMLNCRLLDISDMRDTAQSFLPRIFHRFSLWSWQEKSRGQVMHLRMKPKSDSLEDFSLPAGDKLPACRSKVRFVVVSDTHGWDEDLQLPSGDGAGDVLLHCGDLLFESGHADLSGDTPHVPSDLRSKLDFFNTKPFKRFQWIFIVCGNHDQSFYDLWSDERGRRTLCSLLPDNVVLLQAYTGFEGWKTVPSGLAMSEDIQACVEDGAVWLVPSEDSGKMKLNLRKPSLREKEEKHTGWVIAGSGVSLANNSWSANRAFQLVRPTEKDGEEVQKSRISRLEQAAEALTKHKPDIIMSHGPPKANLVKDKNERVWDEGKGDECFRKELERCESWKIVLFGHAHSLHGVVHKIDGRPFINAATCTQLYVPSRPPIVFDLGTEVETTHANIDDAVEAPLLSESGSVRDGGAVVPGRSLRTDCVVEWVPEWFVHPQVVKLWNAKKREEAAKQHKNRTVELAEFDVCGPAVLYAFRAIWVWVASLALTPITFLVTGEKSIVDWVPSIQTKPSLEHCFTASNSSYYYYNWDFQSCGAFMAYPQELLILLVPTIIHHIWVQVKCLRYLIVPQVQLLSRGRADEEERRQDGVAGFTILGCLLPFNIWMAITIVQAFLGVLDVAIGCVFYGQFLRTVYMDNVVYKVWEKVIRYSMLRHVPMADNIVILFTLCWAMFLLQALWMVLHMSAAEDEGVSYNFGSMKDGYRTLASHIFQCPAVESDPRPHSPCCRGWRGWSVGRADTVKYWHADIVRACARFGKMPALLANEAEVTLARLEKELEKGSPVRFLEILRVRAKEYTCHVFLIDVMEKAVRLEVTVSLFAIDLALNGDDATERAYWESFEFFSQAFIPICLSMFTAGTTLFMHVRKWWKLWYLSGRPFITHHSNVADCEKTTRYVKSWLAAYLVSIILLALIIVHATVKFVFAHICSEHLWNLSFTGSGCVPRPTDV